MLRIERSSSATSRSIIEVKARDESSVTDFGSSAWVPGQASMHLRQPEQRTMSTSIAFESFQFAGLAITHHPSRARGRGS